MSEPARPPRPDVAAQSAEPDRVRVESAAFRALPDPVWLKSPEGSYLAANTLFEQLCGAPPGGVAGRRSADFVDPARAAAYDAQDAAVIDAGRPLAFETDLRFPGEEHAFRAEVVKAPLRDDDGRLLGVLGMARDVSAREESRATLELQNAVLQRVASGQPLDRSLDFLVRKLEERAPGLRASVLLLDEDGRRLRHCAAPSLPAAYCTAVDGLVVGPAAGSCGTAAFRREPVVVEDIAADPLWEDFRALALPHGLRACWSTPILGPADELLGTFALYYAKAGPPPAAHRRLVELATTVASIAVERSREMEALRRSEGRHRLLAENATDVVWLYDAAGDRFEYVSPSVERQSGFKPDEIVGRPLESVVAPADAARLRSILADVMAGPPGPGAAPAPRTIEFDQLARDGSSFPVEVVATLLVDADGRPRQAVGVTRDLRERRRAEEDRRRLEEELHRSRRIDSIVRLAGGIAHDFNNMLAVIQGWAALSLEELGAADPARGALAEIETAARRAATSVKQLLAFAQRAPAEPRILDLNAVLAREAEALAASSGGSLSVGLRASEGLWPVRVDPLLLDQLLRAIVDNAREAAGESGRVWFETGNVRLDESFCESRPGAAPGDYVLLSVRDDGPGMESDVLARAFEPFFTTKARDCRPGRGLGLSTAYGIVKQSGGHVEIESAPGAGTCVRVRLPRHAGSGAVPAAAGTAADTGPVAAVGAGRGTALVVEDEPAILSLGARMLRRLGYEVIEAPSAEQALDAAAGHSGPIELLVTDVVLPGMNGRELADRLAAGRPETAVLFMSGYAADGVAPRGVSSDGAADTAPPLLPKPFSPGELADAVRLAHRRARQAARLRRPAAPAPRVLYVDDEGDLVELMTRALRRRGLAVTAFADPLAALGAFQAEPDAFDAVVSDLSMPFLHGRDLARQVVSARPGTPVILLSGWFSPEDEDAARAAGAAELLLKASTVDELAAAVEAAVLRHAGVAAA